MANVKPQYIRNGEGFGTWFLNRGEAEALARDFNEECDDWRYVVSPATSDYWEIKIFDGEFLVGTI